jgi:hypothetical protein
MKVLDRGTIGKYSPHKLNLLSRVARPRSLSADDVLCSRCRVWATVGLSARISTNACPMSCKNLLIDLYEPNPRSCLMTSRDSIIRANCDLALTWPPIRYMVVGMTPNRPPAGFAGRWRDIQAVDDWSIPIPVY